MEQTITALEVFEQGLSKSDIKNMADAAVKSVLDNGNPLQVAEAISAMEVFIKEVKDRPEFKEYVREEAIKYGKVFNSPSGAKIEVCEVGSKYDYSQCGDETLVQLETILVNAKEAVDKRQAFLKTVPAGGMLVTDELTGETCKVYPPSKSSTSSYKITLAK